MSCEELAWCLIGLYAWALVDFVYGSIIKPSFDLENELRRSAEVAMKAIVSDD